LSSNEAAVKMILIFKKNIFKRIQTSDSNHCFSELTICQEPSTPPTTDSITFSKDLRKHLTNKL